VTSPLLILLPIVYYNKVVLTYSNSMNPPKTLAWLKMYRFLYLEQTTQEKTGHQLTKPNYSTAKKLPYSH